MPAHHSHPEAVLTVTGWGMASSLGLDVVTSCAAARASIRRASEIADLVLPSEEDGKDVLPIGHPAALLTHGFEGYARLVRLLQAGLRDLVVQAWPNEKEPLPGTTLYLSLPHPQRVYSRLDLITNQERRRVIESEGKADDRPPIAATAASLISRAATLLRWKSVPRLAFVTTAGRTGVTEALKAAMRDLATAPEGSRAIVGGVDSLLDSRTLEWLNETGQLKHANNPVGVEPGEAAGFLVVERADGVDRSTKKLRARLSAAVHVDADSASSTSGDCLSAAILAAHEAAGGAMPRWLLSDHDGTPGSALEMGGMSVRLTEKWQGVRPHFIYPTLAFGDVGAAMGAVASCLAIAAWDRGWAPEPSAIITSGNGQGCRAAHVLLAPSWGD